MPAKTRLKRRTCTDLRFAKVFYAENAAVRCHGANRAPAGFPTQVGPAYSCACNFRSSALPRTQRSDNGRHKNRGRRPPARRADLRSQAASSERRM
jgi:hypothetical protein